LEKIIVYGVGRGQTKFFVEWEMKFLGGQLGKKQCYFRECERGLSIWENELMCS